MGNPQYKAHRKKSNLKNGQGDTLQNTVDTVKRKIKYNMKKKALFLSFILLNTAFYNRLWSVSPLPDWLTEDWGNISFIGASNPEMEKTEGIEQAIQRGILLKSMLNGKIGIVVKNYENSRRSKARTTITFLLEISATPVPCEVILTDTFRTDYGEWVCRGKMVFLKKEQQQFGSGEASLFFSQKRLRTGYKIGRTYQWSPYTKENKLAEKWEFALKGEQGVLRSRHDKWGKYSSHGDYDYYLKGISPTAETLERQKTAPLRFGLWAALLASFLDELAALTLNLDNVASMSTATNTSIQSMDFHVGELTFSGIIHGAKVNNNRLKLLLTKENKDNP